MRARQPLAPGAYLAPYADCAHCPFKLRHPECGLLCVEFVKDKLKRETTGSLAAILVEPMQGTAGNVIPPPDWLPAIADVAKENDALLVADEMITGLGRTGHYFAVERSKVPLVQVLLMGREHLSPPAPSTQPQHDLPPANEALATLLAAPRAKRKEQPVV